MTRVLIALSTLVVIALCTPAVNAQWGIGGLSTFQDIHEITSREIDPLESIENVVGRDNNDDDDDDSSSRQNKDILDEIRGLDEPQVDTADEEGLGGGGGSQGSSGGGSKKSADDAARHTQEYSSQWMPSARPGFVVPEIYRRQLTSDMMDSVGDTDPEEEERERARKSMPKSSPGKTEEAKGINKCLRQVSRFCSFNTMAKDFATFSTCCFDVRHHMKKDCFEWSENHGRCAPDMRAHCPNMPPSETTECLLKAQTDRKISQDCLDSPHFKSMEEGAEDMREQNRAVQEASMPTKRGAGGGQKKDDGEENVEAGLPADLDDQVEGEEGDDDVEVTKDANFGSADEL